MDPRFFRKYADLVEAAEQDKPVLNEGVMDAIKSMASKLMPKLSSDEIAKMKAAAQAVLGKPTADSSDFTLDNIKAIAQKLGVQKPAAPMEEGVVDSVKGFFGQKSVDPKTGKGNIGPVDAWHKDATLGEKLASLTGIVGGTAATIAGFFGGPAWLIIPGILALMFLSQVGGSKEDGHY